MKDCKSCQFWKPTYRGVGECSREGRFNIGFWIDGGNASQRLLTLADFGCTEHQAVPANTRNDTV